MRYAYVLDWGELGKQFARAGKAWRGLEVTKKGVSVFREVLRPVQPSAKGFAKGKGFVGLCQLKQPSSFRREDYDFLV